MTTSKPPTSHLQLTSVREIINQYVDQLCHGCGSPACTQDLCDTGRRSNAPPNKPIRTWTPRSARSIAIAIAGGPSPRRYLCKPDTGKHTEIKSDNGDGGKNLDEDFAPGLSPRQHPDFDVTNLKAPRDPSSFVQLLSDTPSIRKLCSGTEPIAVRTNLYNDVSRTLDPLLQNISVSSSPAPTPAALPSNTQAASLILKAIEMLLADLPNGTPTQWLHVNDCIETGCAVPSTKSDAPSDGTSNDCLAILDKLDDLPANRLLSKVAQAVALRTKLEDNSWEAKRVAGMDTNSKGKSQSASVSVSCMMCSL